MNHRAKRLALAIGWAILATVFYLWRAPGFEFFAVGSVIDHGYQAAVGQQVFHGAVSGVDFFTQYGPAIGWVSALSWATGHVWLAEVVCWCLVLGTSQGLLWWWVGHDQRFFRKAGVLLLPFFFTPFYAKYYFVVFPALFLVVIGEGQDAQSGRSGNWRFLGAGLVAGVAGLFRIELGLALTAAGSIYLGWDDLVARRWPRASTILVGGAAGVAGIFFLSLILSAHSVGAPVVFLDFQWAAMTGKVAAFSRNEVSLRGLFHVGAAGFWGLVSLTVLYGLLAVAGFRPDWRKKMRPRLWATGLIGCALLPQAMHNTGVMYVLQIGFPACACLVFGCLNWWEIAVVRTRLLAGIALILGAGLAIFAHSNYDYVSWDHSPVRKIASLYAENPRSGELIRLAAAVQRLAPDGGSLLIGSLDCHLYAQLRRPWAGLIPHLVIPLPTVWQQRCVDKLRQNPPTVVLLPKPRRGFSGPFDYFGRNPLIEKFIRENFVLADSSVDGWRIFEQRVRHQDEPKSRRKGPSPDEESSTDPRATDAICDLRAAHR